MKTLNSLFYRYSKVKIVKPTTLFDVEPEWEMLRKNRCPICGSLLKFPLKRKVAICRGKRHGDKKPFSISLQKLAQLGLKK